VGIDTGMRDECGHTPQAFTKVSEYIQWIGSIVWAEYNETEDTSKEGILVKLILFKCRIRHRPSFV